MATPPRKVGLDAAKSDFPVERRIVELFGKGSPTAIPWLVIAVVVDSIKRLVFRGFLHIFQKIFVFAPSGTDRNSTSTIPVEPFIVGVEAPGTHCIPHSIGLGGFPVSGMAMLKIQAPTRLSWALCGQPSGLYSSFLSAITGAFPSSWCASCPKRGRGFYRELTNAGSRFNHGVIFSMLAISLQACATSKPPEAPLPPIIITKTVFQYPTVPAEHLLPCPAEPVAPDPDTATDAELGAWAEQNRSVAGDCRAEAGWWQDYAKKWPK